MKVDHFKLSTVHFFFLLCTVNLVIMWPKVLKNQNYIQKVNSNTKFTVFQVYLTCIVI
jgi:hypothetical protein